jgi:hypothetical protein
LNQAGLHVFKHKKRILYISTIRPQLFDPNQAKVSSGVEAILASLRSYPRITRKQLAEKVLKRLLGEKSADENSPEYLQAKNSLPTDLLWLAKAGHVIEFADGTLDLPLPPKAVEKPGATGDSGAQDEGASEEQAETESAVDVSTIEETPQEVEATSEESVEHPAVEQQPFVEEHAPVQEHAPVEEHAPNHHQAPSEVDAPVEQHASVETHAPVAEHVVQPAESVVTEAPSVPAQEAGSQEQPEAKVEPTEVSHTQTSAAPEPHESTPVEPTAITDSHDKSPTTEEEWATAGK